MKKYILSAILISNSALLMSQNIAQTNILVNQTNVSNSDNRNWFTNETKTNKPQTNINRQTNTNKQQISIVNIRGNEQRLNLNNVSQNRGRGTNPVQTVNRNTSRNVTNPVQVQRSNPINENNTNIADNNNEIQIQLNDKNVSIINNGNLYINLEPVQAKQIQFLADNNKTNIQITKPDFNFSLEFDQQIKVKTEKVKTTKTKISLSAESESGSVKIKDNILSSSKIKEEKSVKHKGGASYSQKHKSYLGKKIKIWCKKNLKFAKKIRMKVSCPKF